MMATASAVIQCMFAVQNPAGLYHLPTLTEEVLSESYTSVIQICSDCFLVENECQLMHN